MSSAHALKFLSFNIHHGRGMDNVIDLSRIATVIAASGADIVSLQEVDQATTRSLTVKQAHKIATLCDMPHIKFGSNLQFGNGDYGNAVLSRFDIDSCENFALPHGKTKSEQRGVLHAKINVPEFGILHFFATHFDHRPNSGAQLEQAKFIVKLMAEQPETDNFVIAGDLNSIPDSEAVQLFRKSGFQFAADLKTFPAKNPERQIDYIMCKGKRMKLNATIVIDDEMASDHRPLLSEVILLEKKEDQQGVFSKIVRFISGE